MEKILIIISLLLFSCSGNDERLQEALSIVIKLKSAETNKNYSAAKEYINLKSVYGDFADESMTSEQVWKAKIDFLYSIGNDKRMLNSFPYYNFNLDYNITNEGVWVIFEDENKKSKITKIKYLINNDKVSKIEYVKKEDKYTMRN